MVRLVTAFWNPGALAVRIATPVFTPVSVNVAVVAPAAMVKVAGETVAMVVSLLPRVTTVPAAGAGPSSVTVALKLRPTPSKGPGVVSVILRSVTFTVAGPLVNPVADAVMVALPAVVPAVTWKVAVVCPCSTVTLAGTVATDVLLLPSVTVSPFVGAGEPSVTVIVPEFVAVKLSGFGVKTMLFGAAETVTV